MIKKGEAEKVKERIGFSNAFGVSSIGRASGLCIYWNDTVTFSLVSYSQNHVCGDVVSKGGIHWRFVGIYGWPEENNKHHTWELVRSLCMNGEIPLVVGGDFNEILEYGEKEGGADRIRPKMANFRDAMDDCGLRDLRVVGQWYTYKRAA